MSNEILLMNNRQLIPRWHTSRKAMSLQFPSLKANSKTAADFTDDNYLSEARTNWKEDKNYFNAIELYTSLCVRGIHSDKEGDETLNYLLKMENHLPKGALDLISTETKHIDKSVQFYSYNPIDVHKIIARLRAIVRRFSHDYMTWCDLGFYYTVLGMTQQAEKCLDVAWHLCNGHPYITRAIARFFVHQDEPEKAVWYLKRSGGIYHDPLITSAAIGIGSTFNIEAADVRKSRGLLESFKGFKAFSSELAASLATIEFNNGRNKKAKEYFKNALVEPSENALSQYKWLHHKTGFSLGKDVDERVLTVEGDVHHHYVNGEFEKCRSKLLELFSFQPISDGPIADAGYMSLVGLNDPQFVIQLSENRVPKTHMSFSELNNLAVAKLMMNDLTGAEVNMRILAKKVENENSERKGVYYATSGLLMFKIGAVEQGKDLYEKAIKLFESKRDFRGVALAKHYYSLCLREVDIDLYRSLRNTVNKSAKALKMKELEITEQEQNKAHQISVSNLSLPSNGS